MERRLAEAREQSLQAVQRMQHILRLALPIKDYTSHCAVNSITLRVSGRSDAALDVGEI
jgi:hypothetical protein